MRSVLIRLGALLAGIMTVASCDTRLPTAASTGSTPSSPTAKTLNTNKPTVVIDTPLVGTLVNIGDSVLVTVKLHDAKFSLTSASLTGVTESGSVDLGTFARKQRYATITIPPTGSFRTGLRDTTIHRYLKPLSATDTTLDSLIVIAVAIDSAGAADTAQVRVNIVAGPRVSIVSPSNGDSIPAGVGLNVAARAIQPNGVARIDIRVQGEANWPTKLDTTFSQLYTTAPRDITFSAVARIPIDAPLRGKVTITASAVDVNRQPGSSAPLTVFVRSPSAAQPRVTQSVLPRSEFSDSVAVKATGEGIAVVGLIIRDSTNAIIQTDSVKLTAPFNANVQQNVALGLSPLLQGSRLASRHSPSIRPVGLATLCRSRQARPRATSMRA